MLATDMLNSGKYQVDDSTVCLGCEAMANYKGGDEWPGTKLRIISDFD